MYDLMENKLFILQTNIFRVLCVGWLTVPFCRLESAKHQFSRPLLCICCLSDGCFIKVPCQRSVIYCPLILVCMRRAKCNLKGRPFGGISAVDVTISLGILKTGFGEGCRTQFGPSGAKTLGPFSRGQQEIWKSLGSWLGFSKAYSSLQGFIYE